MSQTPIKIVANRTSNGWVIDEVYDDETIESRVIQGRPTMELLTLSLAEIEPPAPPKKKKKKAEEPPEETEETEDLLPL